MITLNLNGKDHELDVPADMPLLWALRDVANLTGTKYGCGMALCGACTVHIDGQATRSCVTPVSAVVGKAITTVEAVSDDPVGKAVQAGGLAGLKTFEGHGNVAGSVGTALGATRDATGANRTIINLTFEGPVAADTAKVLDAVIASYTEFLEGAYRNVSLETEGLYVKARDLLKKDLAERDEEGFYRIVGRLEELVISGGENVYPAEIEDALHAHPDVVEAAVVGVPDERFGEVCAAFVVLREHASATEDELRDHCRERLARFKVPRTVTFVDELPRSSMGKVRKDELRAAVGATQ